MRYGYKKKQWLFNRIVYNSQDKIGDLLLFSEKDLCTLFDGFTFSHRSGLTWEVYIALRNTMLNERQYIEKVAMEKTIVQNYDELYALQDKVLGIVFSEETPFYLTGGTALHRFYCKAC